MLGENEKWQDEMITVPGISSLIPEDHILYKVDRVLKTRWFREEVRGLYCETHGRPSIDPESALRLMLAGFFLGIEYDRQLMREAYVNVAIRWFSGYGLIDKLPHHSSLTRTRQRWGWEILNKVFQQTIKLCADAGLLSYETVHVDATLIRANASWESIVDTYVENVFDKNKDDETSDDEDVKAQPSNKAPKKERRSKTDPDASLTRTNKKDRLELCYKQHTAVDDRAGVVVDVDVTTGKVSESTQLIDQVERVERNTGVMPQTVTADAGYATSENYRQLEEMGIDPVIPPQSERKQGKSIPIRRFKYDEQHHLVTCPQNKKLKCISRNHQGWVFKAKIKDCQNCPLRKRCVPPSSRARSVLIVFGYTALLRARRRKRKWDEKAFEAYKNHRWIVEGRHGEAKVQYGLRRAHRRGLAQVLIQAYMTAAVMNLKRLAAFCLTQNPLLKPVFGQIWRLFSILNNLFLFSPSNSDKCKTMLATA